ncbi:glutathione S-transferase family protein [Luteolibacter pohnpeiensis]|uniref:Glutathione S-transferase family protein n=1 Tax=Luteolibacter pohnpeiensis TaxID=454153 RepID=A0A934S370_9BACT|nr:glutathione S-transferase family protein [Luteolibacter pohnpeiensis]MBK1881621.1 glutathione S-transferase family protein [Luteolibacter pohnpeiensis]
MNAQSQFPDEQDANGGFVRQADEFRQWLGTPDADQFPAVAGRYHLYISLACPWASRTLIVRNVKGLKKAISVSVVDPIRDEKGWAFREGPGYGKDPINGFNYLSEAYFATDAAFKGRITVPVLWDKEKAVIVNNSEDDICRMLNDDFGAVAESSINLFPAELEPEHANLAQYIYENVNNGVYRAGFATSQTEYNKAFKALFAALDELELRLSTKRYLFGDQIVEADWRLFCTLVRFDAVYHGHFKCNLRRIVDYPNLHGYLLDLFQHPGIAGTVNFDHIKRHYYFTHDDINPSRIVPLGPALDFTAAHGRDALSHQDS